MDACLLICFSSRGRLNQNNRPPRSGEGVFERKLKDRVRFLTDQKDW